MPNHYFKFKQFTVYQDKCSQKVSTDACVFGTLISLSETTNTVLDIGTGTGLLSLMLAQKKANIKIDAIEIDKDTLEQAKQNFEQSFFSQNINAVFGDILNFNGADYDVIVSNPPFYEGDLKSTNASKNTAWHSQHLPLNKLIKKASTLMHATSVFYILLPLHRIGDLYKACIISHLYITKVTYIRKSPKHKINRVVVLLSKSNINEVYIDLFTISSLDGNYSQEFVSCMQDYYIKL